MDRDKRKEVTTKILMLRLEKKIETTTNFSFKPSLIPSFHSSRHFLNPRKKTFPDA